MKIVFGLGLDGYDPLLPRPSMGELTCGPMGFLQALETRLGLKRKPASAALRVMQLRRVLSELTTEQITFYGESFAKDPLAVSETLLRWRDDLVAAGWDGSMSANGSARMRDLATVESRSKDRLAPGSADRLRWVLEELSDRSPGLESLTVLEPREHLPKLWSLVCDRLDASYRPVGFASEQNSTDLNRIQSAMTSSVSAQKLELRGDGSVLCMTSHSALTLAHGVAQCLHQFRAADDRSVTLLADEAAGVLDQTLSRIGEPTVGFRPGSKARPIPQLLSLALRLYWKPLDPGSLLEFLTHPVCPVRGVLRYKLANAIADCPGIGGPVWNAASASAKESIEATMGRKDADQLTEPTVLGEIEQDLRDWVLVGEFDSREKASGAKLGACCRRVGRWAGLQIGGARISEVEEKQFLALANLGSELADLLESEPEITRTQVERLLEQVTSHGWVAESGPEELGHVHRLRLPGAVFESVDRLVWWNFTQPFLLPRCPWTNLELEQWREVGVEIPSAETVAKIESANWLRPVLAARKQLILVYPRQNAGEPVAHHPLLARLRSMLSSSSTPLPVIDLDDQVTRGSGEGPSAPWEFSEAPHRPLPAMKRWWRLSEPALLSPREVESYSSAAKFVYQPSAWVFQYKCGLKVGPVARLRLQNRLQQEGTLLHRTLERLLADGSELDWKRCTQAELEVWLDQRWTPLLEQGGANLLLPGRRAEALALRELAKQALSELLDQLRHADIVSARTNVTPADTSFIGGKIGGEIDLVVRNRLGQVAVVDLKLGGREAREKELRENRPLQLAIYGHILRGSEPIDWPVGAYFFLRKERLVAISREYFPGAQVIKPLHPPEGMVGLGQCWADFEKVWQWRRAQLNEGWIEVTTASSDPSLDLAPSEAGPAQLTLPTAAWAFDENAWPFDEFASLAGWRPGA